MVKRRSTGDDRRDLKPRKFAETMKNASVFLRRFLLLVFYANISTTSSFHLEGVKVPKATSPGVKERWSGPSRTRQFHSESISERKHSVLSQGGDLLAMTPSSPIMTSRRPNEREDGGYHRDQEMDVEEDDNEDEERHSQTDSRDHHFSSDCRKRLDVVIESCLDGYERMLRNINPKEQFNDSVKLELCHEYEKTMQCLHLSFEICGPGHLHLQMIAYRLGYLRTFMEQTCDHLDKEEEEEDDDGGQSLHQSPATHSATTIAYLTSGLTVNRPQIDRQETGVATTHVSSRHVDVTLRGAFATPIVVPSDLSESRTVAEPLSSHSASNASNLSSDSLTTSSAAPSPTAARSASIGATTSSHLRMTAEHVSNGAGVKCGDLLGCGGRESDVDRQQRISSLRMRTLSSQHPTTASTTILASSIFPILNATLSRSFNGGLTLNQAGAAAAATVAIQKPLYSSLSTRETAQTGALVTAPSSVGGTKAVQCHPGVTCSRTNSAGTGNRSHSLDYCLALSVIVLLMCRVSIYPQD